MTASPANAAAPATVILYATASDSDGSITQVEFFSKDKNNNVTTPLATIKQAPYSYHWSEVAQGSYDITVKATDNLGASTVSAAVPVSVAAGIPKIYDIATDHIDTPRVITDSSGNEVWRWDSAPFGETQPNEQPRETTGKFTFNLRFPGQYFDAETGLHYNYFRDYDPSTGRYVESDPVGLKGGIKKSGAFFEYDPVSDQIVGNENFGLNPNTYAYAGNNSIINFDSNGTVIMSTVGGLMRETTGDQAARYGSAGNAAATAAGATAAAGAIVYATSPYIVAAAEGVATAAEGAAKRIAFDIRYGIEYKISNYIRIAPWGNRAGNPYGRWPHYHARGPKGPNGEPGAGKGIGRHRPWEPNANDINWCDRFWP